MKTQSGRSMIEMLGVLAIIGVLSVGGLAGYTRAMRSNRVNNALDFVNRCYVEVRGRGDGIAVVDDGACGGTTAGGYLNEVYPNGVSAANCGRATGGATTCTLTLSSGDLGDAFALKVNISSNSQNTAFTRSSAGAWSKTTSSQQQEEPTG